MHANIFCFLIDKFKALTATAKIFGLIYSNFGFPGDSDGKESICL